MLEDRLAIFALRRYGCDDDWKKMKVKFIEDDAPANKRIRPQLGLFTLTPHKYASLEACIGSYCRIAKVPIEKFLTKFTLPYNAAFGALADLELMDITARRIYADIDGISRSAALRVRLAALHES